MSPLVKMSVFLTAIILSALILFLPLSSPDLHEHASMEINGSSDLDSYENSVESGGYTEPGGTLDTTLAVDPGSGCGAENFGLEELGDYGTTNYVTTGNEEEEYGIHYSGDYDFSEDCGLSSLFSCDFVEGSDWPCGKDGDCKRVSGSCSDCPSIANAEIVGDDCTDESWSGSCECPDYSGDCLHTLGSECESVSGQCYYECIEGYEWDGDECVRIYTQEFSLDCEAEGTASCDAEDCDFDSGGTCDEDFSDCGTSCPDPDDEKAELVGDDCSGGGSGYCSCEKPQDGEGYFCHYNDLECTAYDTCDYECAHGYVWDPDNEECIEAELEEYAVEVRRSMHSDDYASGEVRFEDGDYETLPTSRNYVDGEPATVEAEPHDHSTFDYWNTDPCDGSTDPVCEFEVTSDETLYAVWKLEEYTLEYEADTGGHIDGETEQTIKHGEDGDEVTAVPDGGYEFHEWSDGYSNPSRQETNVIESQSYTAFFLEQGELETDSISGDEILYVNEDGQWTGQWTYSGETEADATLGIESNDTSISCSEEVSTDEDETLTCEGSFDTPGTYILEASCSGDCSGSETMEVEVPEEEPVVDTVEATGIGQTEATLVGELVDMGTADEVDVYFEYNGTETDPETMVETGIFEHGVDDLEPGTEYDFRAVADGDGVGEGDWESFETVFQYIYDWYDLDAVREYMEGDYYLEEDLNNETDGYEEYTMEYITSPQSSLVIYDPGHVTGEQYIYEDQDQYAAIVKDEGQGTYMKWDMEEVEERELEFLHETTHDGAFISRIQVSTDGVEWNDIDVTSGEVSEGKWTGEFRYLRWYGNQEAASDGNLRLYYLQATEKEAFGDTWKPIGGYDNQNDFLGSFDGQGHEIMDLQINRSGGNKVGLFGRSGGSIKNISISNANVIGEHEVGIAAGVSSGQLSDVHVHGEVSGENRAGGITGTLKGTVNRSSSYVDVEGTDNHIGGLVGYSDQMTRIDKSYAIGVVTGNNKIGGVVGSMKLGSSAENSYTTADVSGGERVGGFVGYLEGPLENVYAVGSVDGENMTGGLVGENDGTITDAYWDIITTGQEEGVGYGSDDGGHGEYTYNMTLEETFPWDFEQKWGINEEETYPYLQWQREETYPYPEKQELIINVEPTEGGYVSPLGEGTHYLLGDVVELNGTPEDGWFFDSWSGDKESEQDEITFLLDSNMTLTANFNPSLTVAIEGQGLVEVGDPVEDTVSDEQTFEVGYGEDVNLEAFAESSWIFEEWSGDKVGEDSEISVTMDDKKSIVAWFREKPTVRTEAAETVDDNTIRLHGELISTGDVEEIHVYFQYMETGENEWTETTTHTLEGPGEFDEEITDLKNYTEYIFRAVADGHGTGYGKNLTFMLVQGLYVKGSIMDWTTADLEGNVDIEVRVVREGMEDWVRETKANQEGSFNATFKEAEDIERGKVHTLRVSTEGEESYVERDIVIH